MSAVGDSGATRSLLTEESADSFEPVEINPRDPVNVVFGDGAKGTISAKVQLGELEALVVPDLQDNLVSFSDFTSKGSNVVLTNAGGVISNPFNNKRIFLTKDYDTWRLLLADIASYDHKGVSQAIKAYATTIPKSKVERYIALHERLCHQSPLVLSKALEDEKWINAGISAGEVREIGSKYVCLPCVLSKRRAKSVVPNSPLPDGFDGGLNSKTAAPGQIISIDPVGPISPKSVNGFSLFWLVHDVGSSYQWVFFSSSKHSSVVVEILRLIISDLKFFDKELKIVRSDAEEIFNSREIQFFLEERGLKHQYSVPYSHYQNRVERAIQHCVRGVSSLLHSQKWLPASYWEYAAKHFVKVSRYVPTKRTQGSTPSHIMGAGDLDLSVCFPFSFGDIVAIRIPAPDVQWKFDLRRNLGIYLGDADNTKRGFLILDLSSGAVKVRLDCVKMEVVDEKLLADCGARARLFDNRPILTKIKDAKINFENFPEAEHEIPNSPLQFSWSDLDSREVHGGADIPSDLVATQISTSDSDNRVSLSENDVAAIEDVQEAEGEKTFRYLRHNPRYMYARAEEDLSVSRGHVHPFERPKSFAYEAKVTVGKVLKTPEAHHWVAAIDAEISQLLNTGTLEATHITDVLPSSSVINSTMVLKKKPDKYKARLCACGNELRGKIADLFSPTIGALTYSIVHQLAIIDRMRVRIIDTVGAYLYQTYPADAPVIYIRMPVKVMEALSIPDGTVYRLKKYIYGLPDSGRAYYLAYAKLLVDAGYFKSKSDPCLFYRVNLNLGERIYIWIHVDDTFVAASSDELLQSLEDVIRSQYNITVKRDVDTYLGVHFDFLPNGDVKLTQPKLLKSLFEEFSEELAAHRAREPITPQRLSSSKSDCNEPMDSSDYLHLEGALIYLTKSRPDIHTAVSFGATHSVSPTRADFEELIHCLKYLEATQDCGLVLKAGEPYRELILKCYVDASYLTHPDSKSHHGYCLTFGDIGSFYSKSSKQQLVSTSSTQSEVRALQTLVVDIIFIVELCKELQRPIKLPVIVFEDNGAVIALSREMTSRAKRCKHFLMAINWIREQVESGLIQLEQISDAENRSDVLTKIITGMQFRGKAAELLGSDEVTAVRSG